MAPTRIKYSSDHSIVVCRCTKLIVQVRTCSSSSIVRIRFWIWHGVEGQVVKAFDAVVGNCYVAKKKN